MKPTTLAAAVAAGASVILRGHGRAHSPGTLAYRLVSLPERGIDSPRVGGFFAPVIWRDGYGWRPAQDCGGRAPWRQPGGIVGIDAAELVSVVE